MPHTARVDLRGLLRTAQVLVQLHGELVALKQPVNGNRIHVELERVLYDLRPDKIVINIAGDGCFRMNMNELATASRYNIPIIEVIINNNVLVIAVISMICNNLNHTEERMT